MPTLPNYLGVSDNGINLTAPRHQIYQVKLTFVPFSGLEFTPNFTSLRKQATFHDATTGFPGGGGDSAYERGGDACQKFWIKPLKETDLGVAQAFFDP